MAGGVHALPHLDSHLSTADSSTEAGLTEQTSQPGRGHLPACCLLLAGPLDSTTSDGCGCSHTTYPSLPPLRLHPPPRQGEEGVRWCGPVVVSQPQRLDNATPIHAELGCGWPIRTTIACLPYRCVTPRSIHRTVPRRWEEWSEHLATLLAEGLESATVEADASACTNSAAKIASWSRHTCILPPGV